MSGSFFFLKRNCSIPLWHKTIKPQSMKQFFIFSLFVSASIVLFAQEEVVDSVQTEKSVELEGVTVKAARVIQTDEGIKVFPTKKQLESSPNGYSLLQKLALPGIRVDEVMHTVSSPELIGSVQVRINDVVAKSEDLLSLDMAMVQSIDFITSPGLRYGEGVAYVIDIRVFRPTGGHVVGGNVLQSLNRRRNADNAYFRINHGKHEFTFDYDFSWTDFRKMQVESQTDYHLPDGTTFSAQRHTLSNKSPHISNSFSLKYSLAEDEKYLFLATLSQGFTHSPSSRNVEEVVTPVATDTVTTHSKDRAATTQLDLYYHLKLPHAQSFTANAVGTFVGSRYRYAHNAVSPYIYNVEGKTYSCTSEAFYENRLKPFTLSVGAKVHQQYIGNEYTGDLLKNNPLRESGQYLYTQLRGKLFGFNYRAGMGLSHVYYSQQGSSFSYWLPRPNVMLNRQFTPSFSMRYVFDLRTSVPRIAYLTDVVQLNERVLMPTGVIEERTVGNPSIRTTPVYEQTLSATYNSKRMANNFTFFYRNCHHTYMQDFTREVEGDVSFTSSRTNQRSIQMIYLTDYLTLHLIPEVLDFSLNGSFLRCFNFGDNYTHLRNTFMGGADLQAYLGKFTLSAHYDSGWRFLEGESKGDQSYSSYLSASYQLGKWGDLSLYWQHPFDSHPRTERAELLNRYLHKTYTSHNPDLGNMISLNLSVRLSHGRKYQTEQKTLQNTAVDAGVVKQE